MSGDSVHWETSPYWLASDLKNKQDNLARRLEQQPRQMTPWGWLSAEEESHAYGPSVEWTRPAWSGGLACDFLGVSKKGWRRANGLIARRFAAEVIKLAILLSCPCSTRRRGGSDGGAPGNKSKLHVFRRASPRFTACN